MRLYVLPPQERQPPPRQFRHNQNRACRRTGGRGGLHPHFAARPRADLVRRKRGGELKGAAKAGWQGHAVPKHYAATSKIRPTDGQRSGDTALHNGRGDVRYDRHAARLVSAAVAASARPDDTSLIRRGAIHPNATRRATFTQPNGERWPAIITQGDHQRVGEQRGRHTVHVAGILRVPGRVLHIAAAVAHLLGTRQIFVPAMPVIEGRIARKQAILERTGACVAPKNRAPHKAGVVLHKGAVRATPGASARNRPAKTTVPRCAVANRLIRGEGDIRQRPPPCLAAPESPALPTSVVVNKERVAQRQVAVTVAERPAERVTITVGVTCRVLVNTVRRKQNPLDGHAIRRIDETEDRAALARAPVRPKHCVPDDNRAAHRISGGPTRSIRVNGPAIAALKRPARRCVIPLKARPGDGQRTEQVIDRPAVNAAIIEPTAIRHGQGRLVDKHRAAAGFLPTGGAIVIAQNAVNNRDRAAPTTTNRAAPSVGPRLFAVGNGEVLHRQRNTAGGLHDPRLVATTQRDAPALRGAATVERGRLADHQVVAQRERDGVSPTVEGNHAPGSDGSAECRLGATGGAACPNHPGSLRGGHEGQRGHKQHQNDEPQQWSGTWVHRVV